MRFVFALAALVSVVALCSSSAVKSKQHLAEWEDFKNAFNKQYETQEEEIARSKIYLEKRRMIDAHNEKFANGEVSYMMGVNHFTDMTDDEFNQLNGFLVPEDDDSSSDSDSDDYDSRESMHDKKANVTSMLKGVWSTPGSKDWNQLGYVSPPRNQGTCHSCYAFASAAIIESYTAIKNKRPNSIVPLSEQQIVDCSTSLGNRGCNGGNFGFTFEYVKRAGGLDTESSYPYNNALNTCKFKPNVAAKLSGYAQLPQGEGTVRDYVGNRGPIAISIQACSSLSSYAGGIYDDPTCGKPNLTLNHAVVLTGYGSENGINYWIVKNSWGPNWGENGFFRVVRGKGAIGLGAHSFIISV